MFLKPKLIKFRNIIFLFTTIYAKRQRNIFSKGINNMDYSQKLNYHYKTKKGWVNDPNGLVYFDGYYHIFYQHTPDSENPFKQPMHWGHTRTKDFINYEELFNFPCRMPYRNDLFISFCIHCYT